MGPAARRTGAERVQAPMATVAVLVSTAARRAPPPAATRPSDSLGWPDGPRGTLAALGFPFYFSRKNPRLPHRNVHIGLPRFPSRSQRYLTDFRRDFQSYQPIVYVYSLPKVSYLLSLILRMIHVASKCQFRREKCRI